jgi:hypothetical protein
MAFATFILLASVPVLFLVPLAKWLTGSACHGCVEVRPAARERKRTISWFLGFLNVIAFVACVFVLKRRDISGEDLGSDGLTLITYSACKILLAMHLLTVCFTLGALILRMWHRDFRQDETSDLSLGITCLFLGASVLGLVGTVMGLAGLLKLPPVVVLVAPLIFLAPSYVVPQLGSLLTKARMALARQDAPTLTVHGSLAWCLLIVASLSLLWKGLYPASAEADVWEHYLPYYREVLRTGSVALTEVAWPHYWASKAAGLIHIMGVLSDEFSAQLVSWVLMSMTTMIVIDLLRSALNSTAWALLGAIVFLSGVTADPSIGAFTRHHAAITAFVGFLVWAAVQILLQRSAHLRTIFMSALIVVFYAGIYLAQVVPLFAAFLGTLVGAGTVMRRFRFAVKPFVGLLLVAIAGMLTEFAVSYVSTGIASLVSVRLFWPMSDQEKFGSLVGDSGILYLLYTNHDNPPWGEPWPRLARLFRLQHFLPFFAGALAMMLTATLVRIRQGYRVSASKERNAIPAAVTGAFLLISLIPPFVFRNESAMRLYLFLNLLIPIIVLCTLKAVIDTCADTWIKRIWVGGFLIVLSLTVVCVGILPYWNHVKASAWYVSGKLSTAGALKKTADVYSEPERFDFIKAARRRIGLQARIFTLTYAPGPASAFPGRGLMSEPMYSLGPRYLEIVFGPPERAAQLLHEQGIDYFHLSLEGKLFTGLAFSKLFRADGLERRLKLAYREGGQLLLTWRGPGDAEPLPSGLTETLELKQKAVLVYPFETEFFDDLHTVVRTALERIGYCSRENAPRVGDHACRIGSGLAEPAEQMLRKRMAYDELLPQNRASVQAILDSIRREVIASLPKQIPELRRAVLSEQHSPQDFPEALTNRVTTEVVRMAQIAVMNACIERFGRPSCYFLTHRDERIPFGVMYQSKSSVSNILRLNFADVGEAKTLHASSR